jgi:hypothetical protein
MALSLQQVHIDRALSNISIGYKNEQYIADQIFKPVIVNKQSDRYYVYGMERFRTHEDMRAPGTEAHEINWTLSTDTYFCEGHALRHAIADEEVQNADEAFNLEVDGTELVTEGILLNKEVDAANKVLDAANYHSDLVFQMGAAGQPAKWSDYDNSDPVKDINAAKQRLHKLSGIRPNTLILSETVYNVLLLHPRIINIVKYVREGIVTKDLLAVAFGVDTVLVGSALKSTVTNPGQAGAGQIESLNYIWGNSAVLAYIAPTAGRKTISLGYSFMWNKDGNSPVQVRKWYDISRRATFIEAERWYAHKIVSSVAGALFQDAVVPLGG